MILKPDEPLSDRKLPGNWYELNWTRIFLNYSLFLLYGKSAESSGLKAIACIYLVHLCYTVQRAYSLQVILSLEIFFCSN